MSAEDRIRDHEYDGIQEYDNPVPAWWNWIFIGSAVFSIAYFVYFHLGSGEGVIAAYEREVAAIEAARPKPDPASLAAGPGQTEEKLAALMSDAAAVEKGKAKYMVVCFACHGAEGGGLVGPNLTDDHWIHGQGTLLDIHKVVREGVIEKGMAAWEKQMPPEELDAVVAFVGTLRNTNKPGKPPEGNQVGGEAPKADAPPE